MNNENLIRLIGVTKTHEVAGGTFHALREVNLQVKAGEFVAIIGKSGSGKSTMLNMLSGMTYLHPGKYGSVIPQSILWTRISLQNGAGGMSVLCSSSSSCSHADNS